MSRIVGRYKKGEHSHNSSFTSDVTADSALSEGLTAVYRNDPRLGAILSRARLLVNALWARAPALRSSCAALQDTVADKLGEDVPVVWDANYEYAKDEWAGILHFAKYDAAQLERIRAELALCGVDDAGESVPAERASVAGAGPMDTLMRNSPSMRIME